MSFLAEMARVAAKAGMAGVESYARQAPSAPAGRRKKGAKADPNAGCTPCAAMARRRAAMKHVAGLGK